MELQSIVEELKHLMCDREEDARNAEKTLAANLRREADIIRRLEHQVEGLRRDLASMTVTTTVCSGCSKALVHEHYSSEVKRHLLQENSKESHKKRKKTKRKADWSKIVMMSQNPANSSDNINLSTSYPTSIVPTSYPEEDKWMKTPTANQDSGSNAGSPAEQRILAAVQPEAQDMETRMRVLNEKVEMVTSKTHRMIDRTSLLNSSSQALKDQVLSLQHDLGYINRSLT